jgi:hypothetical protein
MFVSPAFSSQVFYERKDRRNRQRFHYPAVVHIDGRPLPGRDISPKGLSVFVAAPAVGDVVTVQLAGADGEEGGQEISSRARVVRVDAGEDGYVVGLEFIE